ncbi:sulfite exporter TauE/SafE family protein [Streptomyces sp. NPDC047072]|uniref:sulfite exporter TauE/SafE family protein n=1 Tax=Streptomyces sp. NPDC047072 TaxID=3154809 RepID=UPI0033DDF147
MSTMLLALVAGAVVGLALGGLGGSGSMLAVPALTYLLRFTPAEATTAALVIVTLTSATALTAHARDGNVAWRTGLLFAAAGIAPAVATGTVSAHLPGTLLTTAFAVIAALAALRMLRPAPTETSGRTHPTRAGAAGAGLGAVTGFLGVGGGFLAVPALVNVLGLPMRRAIGTSLLVITLNSLAALTARAGTGMKLDWATIAPFTAAAILAAHDAKHLAHRLKATTLQRTFAYTLLAVAALMLADTLI